MLADNVIFQVPDWNQPQTYLPAPVLYGNWCAPTAAANALGYWEDVKGMTGLTDRKAFGAGPAYPANNNTWQQGLFNDGSIEMGWFMDTGGWRTTPLPMPPLGPGGAGRTLAVNIRPGIIAYASGNWVDPGPGAIAKAAYPNILVNEDATPNVNLAAMWPKYTAEIDAGRPVVSSFLHWVLIPNPPVPTLQINVGGQIVTVELYNFNPATEEHTVTGVGYIDQTPGVFNNDGTERFIVHDNWGNTGFWVSVPVDANWFQNDYIDFAQGIPEPAGLTLLGLALAGLRERRKRR